MSRTYIRDGFKLVPTDHPDHDVDGRAYKVVDDDLFWCCDGVYQYGRMPATRRLSIMLNRYLVHLSVEQIVRIDAMRDENISRAAHIRIAIDQYLTRAARRDKRQAA